MTRHITLLIFALLIAKCCIAQDPVMFTLPADSAISDKNVCKNLRVVDMRKNKEQVGAMSIRRIRDINKMETKVVTEQPLSELLSNYFSRISYKTKGEYELLLILHDFWIMRRYNDMNFGHFFISGDFYIGKDGKYAMLDSVDAIYELSTKDQFVGNLVGLARQAVFQLLNTYATIPVDKKNACTK